ncbi:peptidoglycan DD-metalloendopeptidase family protein [Psychrobacillus sp. OK032]|uniref:peptidoglycan DD-metalloendopeptidase family protein n=1 Tax=Psychrobacillus sp. OK032 TaxID=1884358 RepID=UPI0008D7136C|nr:peptidoglycan DD-metalloendopeptidase family protein [Psychrobacillus sp. OK032]SES34592.1 Putative peptidoglycan binding domain-containing protein [Psychrobacillus sp. OK032]
MFIRPCEGRITSRYSSLRKHPITGEWKAHKGVDFGNDGSTIIKASEIGTVKRAEVIGGYGNTVIITHVLNGKNYETLYAHLKSISVKVGQTVIQGQHIGIKGTTGNSTGVHLHFEMHIPTYSEGQPNAVNPLHYIVDPAIEEIQKMLVMLDYRLNMDGIEGPSTEAAIKAFQETKGLVADGIVGDITLEALNNAVELKKEELRMAEPKLTPGQETIRQEAMRLKITNGNDPFKNVNQYYAWAVAVPIAQKVEELEKRILELEKKLA